MKTAVQSAITQPLFLAIDEAQYLNTGSLNDIKMLMNYGCDYDSVRQRRREPAVSYGTAQSGRQ